MKTVHLVALGLASLLVVAALIFAGIGVYLANTPSGATSTATALVCGVTGLIVLSITGTSISDHRY